MNRQTLGFFPSADRSFVTLKVSGDLFPGLKSGMDYPWSGGPTAIPAGHVLRLYANRL
jgi:hypothetical protein